MVIHSYLVNLCVKICCQQLLVLYFPVNSMRWHIQGKRHKNALEFWKNRQAQAKTSVFVRGFPIGTSEQELWQYFAQFGRVTKVSLVKPKVKN